MELAATPTTGRQAIERYGADGFCVSGVVYAGPVLVFPDRAEPWSNPAPTVEGLAPVIAHGEIELVLIGLGRRGGPATPALRAALRAHGIGVETMETGAACRTYNLLLAEDRRVAAALLPPI
ncbi:MAG TPA: Mth938-like domain-containing protein [Stellaceae bacterium]|nr:Mth938-like domain-containing protein [Stellaceae bacterium]